jgi:glucose/arabinose dehydrogenase
VIRISLSSMRVPAAASSVGLAVFIALVWSSAGNAQQAPAAPAGQPAAGRAGGAQAGDGRGAGRGPVDTLGAGPWEFAAGRGARMRVSVVTKGLVNPWGMAFVPDGSILVTERPGRLRVVRNGVLDPAPIGPLPEMAAFGLGGLMDVSLHPRFAENRLIYFTYSKPDPKQCESQRTCSATTAVARARWDGGATLTNVQDIIVTDAWHGAPGTDQSIGPASGSYGSRLAWDRNGLLYITSGDRNYPEKAQDTNSHIGKILRLRDDGTVPPDNPFVGDKFPTWKGNAMVGAMRNQTGKYVQRVVFNAKALPTGRESMLVELNQRIRDVRQGPDGLVYVLTDEAAGAMLKIEPVAQ